MKAILVIDIDEKYIGAIGTEIQFINQKYNCKWELKPMPNKRVPNGSETDQIYGCYVGWNACIDEILGEAE